MRQVSFLNVDTIDGVAILTLNDPTRRNILSSDMAGEIIDAINAVEMDENCRVVVITGAAPAFCAGAHLEDLLDARNGKETAVRRVYDGFLAVARCKLPTIAAVNGPAIGAGMNLALACDLRIASLSALFDTRFLQLGLHQGGGHGWMLLRSMSAQEAAGLLLFGEKVDGETAVKVGLAKFCTSNEKLITETLAYAARAAQAPRELLIRIKQSLIRSEKIDDHKDALELETIEQMWSLQQPAFSKLTYAMREKVSSDR